MTTLRRFGRALLLLAGFAAAGLLLRQSGLGGLAREAGTHGPVVFLLLATALCAVGVPRQAVAYAAGLAFGAGPGTALALVAEVAGAAASFLWAAVVARDWASRLLERRGGTRLLRLRDRLLLQPFSATLVLRLLPVGNSLLLSLLAGVAGLRAAPFLLASAIGFVPQTLVFSLLGDGVQVDGTVQIVLAAVMFVLSAALGLLLMRRTRAPAGAASATVDLPRGRA